MLLKKLQFKRRNNSSFFCPIMLKYKCLERSDTMGKIVLFMGKSASGKDAIRRHLIKTNKFAFKEMIMSTTRPIRTGEIEGREYYFKTEEEMHLLEQEKKIIESRKYNTIYGPWYYFTTSDSIDLNRYNYIGSNTLVVYDQFVKYYGTDKIIPILIDVKNDIRLERALERERKEKNPKYQELCRRFLADSEDFSLENIKKRNITNIISNNGDFNSTIEEVEKVIKLSL